MTSRQNKILEEIHPLNIIKEVEKWPALYAKDSCERSNTHFRLKIWCEVAKSLFPDWNSYSKTEQSARITDLSKRWRNLRDTFKREVEIEKKIQEGQDIRKKPYVYSSHMSFLRPHLDPGVNARRRDLGASSPAPSPEAPPAEETPAPLAYYIPEPAEEIDEDKHFALSLIPSLKKMTENDKLTAKVEILKVIKKIRSRPSRSNVRYQAVDALSCTSEDVNTKRVKRELFGEVDLEEMSPSSADSVEDSS